MNVELLHVVPGPGVVARRDRLVLWAEPTDLRREGLFAEALRRLTAPDADPQAAVEWVLQAARGASTLPAFALCVSVGAERVVACAGWGAVVTGRGVVELGRVVRLPADGPLAVGRAGLAALGIADTVLGLERGVVPGGAAVLSLGAGAAPREARAGASDQGLVSLAPASRAAAEAAHAPVGQSPVAQAPVPPAAMPEPAPSAPPAMPPPAGPAPQAPPRPARSEQIVVSLAADLAREPVPARPSLPVASAGAGHSEPAGSSSGVQVPGIVCARKHFNNPNALYCRVCGISMHQQTHTLVQGERPPLGVLVTDEGTTFALDADYAVGSGPAHSAPVHQGLARPLTIGDQHAGVAQVHIAITLNDWDVLAWNQSPGLPAAVLHRGDREWMPIAPGHHIRLLPGSFVGFAGRHLVFESNNRA